VVIRPTSHPFPRRDSAERNGLVAAASALAAVAVGAIAFYVPQNPRHFLFVAVGLIVAAVCVFRVDLALLLLVASAPLESAFQLGSSDLLTPTKLAGALAFTSFALHAMFTRRRLFFDRIHAVVFLLLGLAMVSTLQAEGIDAAVATTQRYASFVALYFVISQFIGDHRLQRRIAWTLSLASSVAALIALENFFFSGGAYVYRAALPYGDPNDLAYVLATTLPLTFWLLRERWVLRPVVLGMIAVILPAILFTYSRGALVGLAAGILWLIITERRYIPFLAAAGIATIVAAVAFIQENPDSSFRLQEGLRAKEKVASYNVDSRLTAWRAASELAADHPLLGIGPGNFQFHYAEVAGIPPGAQHISVVHNAYLDIAAELGFVGLGLFLLYLFAVFARLTVANREGRGPPGYAGAVRTAFVVAAIGAFTLSEQYYAPLWLLGALATALWAEGRDEAPAEELVERPLRPQGPDLTPVRS
jgi:putative inorganic carbon (HCO3(-)) transporter